MQSNSVRKSYPLA
ncbi:hypothetical protein PLES 10461 [Pseudomonas aeruginosa]|nr:hypothetical protein PLES 10461 [Pseudomonas aeruginosa]